MKPSENHTGAPRSPTAAPIATWLDGHAPRHSATMTTRLVLRTKEYLSQHSGTPETAAWTAAVVLFSLALLISPLVNKFAGPFDGFFAVAGFLLGSVAGSAVGLVTHRLHRKQLAVLDPNGLVIFSKWEFADGRRNLRLLAVGLVASGWGAFGYAIEMGKLFASVPCGLLALFLSWLGLMMFTRTFTALDSKRRVAVTHLYTVFTDWQESEQPMQSLTVTHYLDQHWDELTNCYEIEIPGSVYPLAFSQKASAESVAHQIADYMSIPIKRDGPLGRDCRNAGP